MCYFSINSYYDFHNLFDLSPYVYSISYCHFNVPSPSLGTEAPICQSNLLPREFFCLMGSQMWMLWRNCWGLSGPWTIDSWCSSMWALMLLLEVTVGVSIVTEGLWRLEVMEVQMVFSSVAPIKGKGWGMIAGSCRSTTPVLTTGVYYWLWDLLCGSRSARERWDEPDKVGWNHLFHQTGQSSEQSLKLWTAGEGYNESKSNAEGAGRGWRKKSAIW